MLYCARHDKEYSERECPLCSDNDDELDTDLNFDEEDPYFGFYGECIIREPTFLDGGVGRGRVWHCGDCGEDLNEAGECPTCDGEDGLDALLDGRSDPFAQYRDEMDDE